MCTAQNVHTEVPQPRQLATTNIATTARLLGADRRKKVHTGGGRFDPSTIQIWANWGAGTEGGAGHMYGLYEALRMLHEEGLENAWQRHRTQHEGLVRGLEGIGLEFVVDADYRLPQLNVVQCPDRVDEVAVRKQLLAEFNLEISC